MTIGMDLKSSQRRWVEHVMYGVGLNNIHNDHLYPINQIHYMYYSQICHNPEKISREMDEKNWKKIHLYAIIGRERVLKNEYNLLPPLSFFLSSEKFPQAETEKKSVWKVHKYFFVHDTAITGLDFYYLVVHDTVRASTFDKS